MFVSFLFRFSKGPPQSIISEMDRERWREGERGKRWSNRKSREREQQSPDVSQVILVACYGHHNVLWAMLLQLLNPLLQRLERVLYTYTQTHTHRERHTRKNYTGK